MAFFLFCFSYINLFLLIVSVKYSHHAIRTCYGECPHPWTDFCLCVCVCVRACIVGWGLIVLCWWVCHDDQMVTMVSAEVRLHFYIHFCCNLLVVIWVKIGNHSMLLVRTGTKVCYWFQWGLGPKCVTGSNKDWDLKYWCWYGLGP